MNRLWPEKAQKYSGITDWMRRELSALLRRCCNEPLCSGIDQSTSEQKAVLFGQDGMLVERYDLPHEQKISPEGWVPMIRWKFTAIRFWQFPAFSGKPAYRLRR